jgi:hypothetical protein
MFTDGSKSELYNSVVRVFIDGGRLVAGAAGSAGALQWVRDTQ